MRAMPPRPAARPFAASARQSCSGLSRYMKTRGLCRNNGLRRPAGRMKCPSRMAPASRKTSMTSASVMSLPFSLIHPDGFADDGAAAELGEDAGQVLHVENLHVDEHDREIVGILGHME